MSYSAFRRIFLSLIIAVPLMLSSMPSFSGDVVSSGTFTGTNNHVTNGTVSVEKDGDNYVVVLGADFDFDGAPDPKVGFGTSGNYDIKSQLAHLKSNKGEQRYEIPADLNIEGYNEIYIWCEQYSVSLGVAEIN